MQTTLITQVFVSHALLTVKDAQQLLYAQPVIQDTFSFLMEYVTIMLATPAYSKLEIPASHATQAINLTRLTIAWSALPATAIHRA
jgi:hypothetical protein